MNAGREMDAWVAEKAMGFTGGFPEVLGEHWIAFPDTVLPRYSTDIAAAWKVVDRLIADLWHVEVHVWNATATQVSVICNRGPCERHGNPHHDWHGVEALEAETTPLAICRAALLALGVES